MILSFWDFFLLLIQLPLALWLVKKFSKKVEENLRPHFIRGLSLKLYACILLGLVYQYYYGFGDTLNYFKNGTFLTGAIIQSPQNIFKYLFATEDDFYKYFSYYIDQQYEAGYYFKTSNITILKLVSVANLFSLGGFFGTGFIFCFFAFWGQWKIFKVFYNAYPDIGKKFAYSFYVPSVVFWSSGILKDSVCLGALGLIIYTFEYFSFKKKLITQLVIIFSCFVLIFFIKSYILFCLIVPLLIWRYRTAIQKITNKILTRIYFLSVIVIGTVLYKIAHIGDLIGGVSLEVIYLGILKTRGGFESGTETDGSSFTMAEFSPTITGFLGQIPKAVNAVLFRPYVWESKKIFSLVAAGESLMFLVIAIYVFYKTGIKSALRTILYNPDVLFCFMFTLFFSTALGLTVTNFGALVRFKIQFLPFMVIGLLLIFYKKQSRNNI